MLTFLLVVFIVLQVLDVLTTNKVLSQGGIEVNPVMVWFMKQLGRYWWVSKIIPVAVMMYWWTVGGKTAFWVLLAGTILYIGVVVNNYFEIKK